MSTWLYQLNAQDWTPETFRYEVWEGRPWRWRCGKRQGKGVPDAGDTIVFFYAPTRCDDPGVYGWAVLDRCVDNRLLYFVPVAPTNRLKMDPWWDLKATKTLVDKIRGRVTRATLFRVEDPERRQLRDSLRRWLAGSA